MVGQDVTFIDDDAPQTVKKLHYNNINNSNVINSVIILVPILCIRINNILTLYIILIMFIMTRPLYSGQVISTCCLIN